MKMKFFAIALMIAAACSSASAQDQKQCCQAPQDQQCGEAPKPGCPMMRALKDLQLTDAQRTAIENLGKERAEAQKQKCEQAAKQRHEADSLARVAQRQEKLDFLKSLKSILTNDQYVSFLENNFVDAQQAPRGEQPRMMGAPGEGPGQCGAKPECGPKPQGCDRGEGPQQGKCKKDGKKDGKCKGKADGKCCKDENK